MTTTAPDIIPRDLRFGVRENADPAWFGGDRMMSAIVDGFAVLLPEGERFFIRSLRHFAPMVNDPEVLAGIRGYAVQEAFHTREHEAYNNALRDLGYDVDAMEERVRAYLDSVTLPRTRLLATCAMEQMTYSLSRFILMHPELMDRAAPAYRRLWRWHALEEVEHAAVALRVLALAPTRQRPLRRYVVRNLALVVAAYTMTRIAIGNAMMMLRASGMRIGIKERLRMAWLLFGYPGFIRAVLVPFLAYLKPGYMGAGGPADQRLVDRGRRLLEVDPPTAVAATAAAAA